MNDPLPISVFNYSDYRELLKDWFWNAKKNNSKISFRFVSRYLGLSAPNHFHLVISQKRHLSPRLIAKTMLLLKLGAREKQYFRLLFSQNTAKSPLEKQELQSKIDQLRKQLVQADLQDDKLPVVAHQLAWYIKMGAIVFSSKTLPELKDLVKRSASFPVTDAEIANAIAILEETKLLRFNNGLSVFDDTAITTKWDLDRFEIKQHHLGNLKLSMESVAWPIDRRFLSSVTVAASEELVQSMISDIRNLCLGILQKANDRVLSADDASKVVTLQFALFPYFDFQKSSCR